MTFNHILSSMAPGRGGSRAVRGVPEGGTSAERVRGVPVGGTQARRGVRGCRGRARGRRRGAGAGRGHASVEDTPERERGCR